MLFRRQLADIDAELAQGRLTPEQATAARSDITRRMLAAAERGDAGITVAAGRGAETSWRIGAAIGIAAVLPAAAIAVYFAVGTPSAVDRSAATDALPPHGAAELAAAADRIETHLQQAPGDLKGWVLLARTLAALGRFSEARDAYAHAIALAPGESGLHAELGEVLVLAAQGTVTPAAEAEFAKAPNDPRSRYYRGRRDAARGRRRRSAQAIAGPAGICPGRRAMAPDRRRPARRAGAERTAGEVGGRARRRASWTERAGRRRRPIAVAGTAPGDDPRHGRAPRPAARTAPRGQGRVGAPCPRLRRAGRARQGAGGARPRSRRPVRPRRMRFHRRQRRRRRRRTRRAGSPAPTSFAGLGRTADSLAALKEGNAQFPGNLALLEAYHAGARRQRRAKTGRAPSSSLWRPRSTPSTAKSRTRCGIWVSPPPRAAIALGRPAIGPGCSARCRPATAAARWCSAGSRRCIEHFGRRSRRCRADLRRSGL